MKYLALLALCFMAAQTHAMDRKESVNALIDLWKTKRWKQTVHPLFLRAAFTNSSDIKTNLALLVTAGSLYFFSENPPYCSQMSLVKDFMNKYDRSYNQAPRSVKKLLPEAIEFETLNRAKQQFINEYEWRGDCFLYDENIRYSRSDFPKIEMFEKNGMNEKQQKKIKVLLQGWLDKSNEKASSETTEKREKTVHQENANYLEKLLESFYNPV